MPTSAALQPLSGSPFPAGIVAHKRAPAGLSVSAAAEERDFEARRWLCTRSSRRDPLERAAALLVAISCNNDHEGRDANAIPDSLSCVADLLGLSDVSLACAVGELEDRGLVATDRGLRVIDPAGLERLAEAA